MPVCVHTRTGRKAGFRPASQYNAAILELLAARSDKLPVGCRESTGRRLTITAIRHYDVRGEVQSEIYIWNSLRNPSPWTSKWRARREQRGECLHPDMVVQPQNPKENVLGDV